jgi:hypothetical protein|tara:strand:- start:452 stop:847 length:396 start_codon:yes stop_codon:yes gene_type:complete
MAPLGPLTTNRLTVRLDPERAARIEYWATENPLKIKSYNQLIQEALDEYLDRHTVSPTHDSMTVKVPQKVREKLHDLQEDGYGNIDQIVSESILQHSTSKYREEKDYQFLRNEVNTISNRRKMLFSDYGSD